MNDVETLLKEREAAGVLGLKPSTLLRWRWSRKGPKWIKLIGGAVRYRKRDLVDFINASEVDHD